MDAGRPWRMSLLLHNDRSYLVFVCHRGLMDDMSMVPMFVTLSAAYNNHPAVPVLDLDQAMLLRLECEHRSGTALQEDLDFWGGELRDCSFRWNPARSAGPEVDTGFTVELDAEKSARLAAHARTLDVPLDVMLVLALHVVLGRTTGEATVLSAHRRRGPQLQCHGVGYDERQAFFRSHVDDTLTWRQFATRGAARWARGVYHGRVPTVEVLQELQRFNPDVDKPTNVRCEFGPSCSDALSLDGLQASWLQSGDDLESNDIEVRFHVRERITIQVRCAQSRVLASVRTSIDHLVALLDHIEDGIDRRIGDLDLFSATLEDRRQAWSIGAPLVRPAHDVMHLLHECIGTHGSAPAVSGPDASYTYAELGQAVARVRAGLPAHRGDTDLVGICMSRGARYVPAILGVLASGAGFVPVDPDLPDERVRFILSDAGLKHVIVDARSRDRVAGLLDAELGVEVHVVEEMLAAGQPVDAGAVVRPAAPAYVIYTSGTTGRPKGVVVERRMLAHLMASLEGVYAGELNAGGPPTKWLQYAALNFDASALEIFFALTHAAHLVIAPQEVRIDPPALLDFIDSREITHAFLPPAILKVLPRRQPKTLSTVLTGGEAGDDDTVRFWSNLVRVSNIYGPTETTVMATENTLGGAKAANHLGRPLPGYDIHLLDRHGRAAPLGGVAELCVGGRGVARGYLNRPELNDQKFVPNPFGSGKIYRTGDLARYLPDGSIEFLGRSDFQVKIRGYRIELGEIESLIAQQGEVHSVLVGTRVQQGEHAIVAWYVADGLDATSLRERLLRKLAHYMVPAHLVRITDWPLTINGKIDRQRLPSPTAMPVQPGERPLCVFEQAVADVWAQTLRLPIEAVGAGAHFFHLGGHSLLATVACHRVNAVLGTQVTPKMLFEAPVLAEFCGRALRSSKNSQSGNGGDFGAVGTLPAELPLAQAPGSNPVSEVRIDGALIKLMHVRSVAQPGDTAYNIVARVSFGSGVDALLLHRALLALLREDALFRCALVEQAGELRLVLDADAVPQAALRRLASDEHVEFDMVVERYRREPIPLAQAPLWRAELLQAGLDGELTLVFCIHHAIFDGWSLKLMLEELSWRYTHGKSNRKNDRGPLNWLDYCAWARRHADPVTTRTSLQYWEAKLAAATLHTALPLDARQKVAQANESLPLHWDSDQVAVLKKIAASAELTLPPVMFALYLVCMWRLSAQASLSCAYPCASREVAGSETIYGMFVSMGLIVQTVDPRQSFLALAREIHQQMLRDRDHLSATPYDLDHARLDALNLIFSFQNGIDLDGRIGDSIYSAQDVAPLTPRAHLCTVIYARADGSMAGRIEYDSTVLRRERIVAMREMLQVLFEDACASPRAGVAQLRYLTQQQYAQCLEFAQGGPSLTPTVSIVERFEEVVRSCPGHVALRDGATAITYRELDALSARLALTLTLSRSYPIPQRLGLSMAPGIPLVAMLLGVLRAGSAYVPLDATYPAQRLAQIVELSGVSAVIADAPSRDALVSAGLGALRFWEADADEARAASRAQPASSGTCSVMRVDAANDAGSDVGNNAGNTTRSEVRADALAYVIFTSGSSGAPKGVLVEHHSVVSMVAAAAKILDYGPGCISTLAASLNFDASVLDIFLALLQGGTLVIVPQAVRKNPAQLHALLKAQHVTHASIAPVLIKNMPQHPLPELRVLGFGGDTLDEQTARWWAPRTRLMSLYGPTEATVMASAGQILPVDSAPVRILGKPLPGYRMYILDAQRQFSPVGTVGEIYIGGDNLARGYTGVAAATFARFVVDPFSPDRSGLMYRSSDLGRYLPDGTIEYFGRDDAQVKIRGQRTELGEIESCIASFPGIRQAVCKVWGNDEGRYIAAYYVAQAEDSPVSHAQLRQHALGALPDFMVPAFFMQIDALPASINGKIERKALPAIKQARGGEAPSNQVERDMAQLWERLLQVQGIGRDEIFFDLGGNSLLVVRLQAELARQFGLRVSLAQIYRTPTIAALASGLDQSQVVQAIRDVQTLLVMDASAASSESDAEGASKGDGQGVGDSASKAFRTVLLTGASGFVGIYLLRELCQRAQKVYCLQRGESGGGSGGADSTNHPLGALKARARAARLDIDFRRVQVVCGDLSKPNLGLDAATWRHLSIDVDAILHCGAFVHHLHGYATMRAANVVATQDLLRLAMQGRAKFFCHISTMSVPAIVEGAQRIEECIQDALPMVDNGYLLSKWVGEQLVAQCASRHGLDTLIIRLGNVTGDSASGYSNYADNHFWRYVKGCIQLGAYAQLSAPLEMMPVDLVARSITELLFAAPQDLLVANLGNPQTLDQQLLFQEVSLAGFELQEKSLESWQRQLEKADASNSLSALKEFYLGSASRERMPVVQSRTVQALDRLGVDLYVDYRVLLKRYLAYLVAEKFLMLPSRGVEGG